MTPKRENLPLSQQAYEQIKQKIVSLELPPGSVIDETALREELGLGRTPIREALQRLSLEKLVEIVPRRGTFVSELGITDLQRLFEVRVVLEAQAARLAAKRGTRSHWERMREALYQLPETSQTISNERLIEIDEACHEIMYEATDNEFLYDTLVTLYALSLRLWYFSLSQIGDMRQAIVEHRQILDALEAGDGEHAETLLIQHIKTFQEEIQAVMLGIPASSKAGR